MTELEAYKAMLDGAKDACHHLRAEITQLRAELAESKDCEKSLSEMLMAEIKEKCDWVKRTIDAEAELEQEREMQARLKERVDYLLDENRIYSYSVDGMSEVKAIVDGDKTNTIEDVVKWVLNRIESYPRRNK